MNKSKRIVLFTALALMLAAVVLFLSFDLVVYVYPEEFREYESRFSRPQFFNRGYFLISRSDTSPSFIEKIKNPSLYIYTPYSSLDGSRISFYTVVDRNGERLSLSFSEEEMYDSFLSSFSDEMIGFAYNDGDSSMEETYLSLESRHQNITSLSYADRVSVVNVDKLNAESSSLWGIIIIDPSSSASLYRKTEARIIMDERDAVFALSLDSVISLHYDWSEMIRNYLKSGESASYYTFSVLHK